MKSVSTAFKTAAVAATITPAKSAILTLLDNEIYQIGITATGNSVFSADVGAFKAANGKTVAVHKWASADPVTTVGSGEIVPDGTWYPCDNIVDTGYWGTILSDGSGNIASGEDLVINYSPSIQPTAIEIWFDTTMGYAVDYVVSYDPGTGAYTTLSTVTGNASLHNIYALPVSTTIANIKVHVTKISKTSRHVKIQEFAATYSIDISSIVTTADVLIESQPSNATVEIGNIAAGELQIGISDSSNLYNPSNSTSQAAQYTRDNRKIVLQFGYVLPDTTTELCNFGTFYTTEFDSDRISAITTILTNDRLKLLRDTPCLNSALYINQTVDTLIKNALIAIGFSGDDYVIASSPIIIPYAWTSDTQTVFSYISNLAQIASGVFYVDENNKFHFEDSVYLRLNNRNSVITLSDDPSSNTIKNISDTWSVGDIRNKVQIAYNSYVVGVSSNVWQQTYSPTGLVSGSIPVGFKPGYNYQLIPRTIHLVFNSPITSLTSVIASSSGTPIFSSLTGSLTLSNSSATSVDITFPDSTALGISTIDTITAVGIPLTLNTSSNITLINQASSDQFGPKPITIPSNVNFQSIGIAQQTAADILSIFNNPPPKLHLECVGLPHLQLGDRVTVQSTALGINTDYYVIHHDFTYDGSFASGLDVLAAQDLLAERTTVFADEWTVSGLGAGTNTMQVGIGASNESFNYTQKIAGYTIGTTQISFSVWLSAGFYIMFTDASADGGVGGNFQGAVEWSLDGSAFGADDLGLYAAPGSTSGTVTFQNYLYIPSDGYHVITGNFIATSTVNAPKILTVTYIKASFQQVND